MSAIATFTVDEFEHMIGCGAFTGPNDRRVELIRGELRDMSPTGLDHEELLDWLVDWSFDTVDCKIVQVRVQESLGIPELETTPLPDLVWARRQRIRRRRPRPSDVLLLAEVADSSVAYDTGEKARLYSEAGVRDYWVVDIPHRLVHVFRRPSAKGYRSHRKLAAGERCESELVSGAILDVSAMFACLDDVKMDS